MGAKKIASVCLYCEPTSPIRFILALGDNFYPHGVHSVDDHKWQTNWADVFLNSEELRVPWKAILGNHDCEGAQAQIDFTHSEFNPSGLWQLPARVSILFCGSHLPAIFIFTQYPGN